MTTTTHTSATCLPDAGACDLPISARRWPACSATTWPASCPLAAGCARVTAPQLGTLVNRVVTSDRARPWSFGVAALMRSLARRGLLQA